MSDPSRAIQEALRARFVASAALVALVPAANILDRNSRPAPDPSIIMGEDQVVGTNEAINRSLVRVYSTLHIWKSEEGTKGVKEIAFAIRRALGRVTRLKITDPDFACVDCRFDSVRFLRDPNGTTAHGIMTINSLVQERWSATL